MLGCQGGAMWSCVPRSKVTKMTKSFLSSLHHKLRGFSHFPWSQRNNKKCQAWIDPNCLWHPKAIGFIALQNLTEKNIIATIKTKNKFWFVAKFAKKQLFSLDLLFWMRNFKEPSNQIHAITFSINTVKIIKSLNGQI